jgi:hypothetical protein
MREGGIIQDGIRNREVMNLWDNRRKCNGKIDKKG